MDPARAEEAMNVAREQVRWWGENGVDKTCAMQSLGLAYYRETWHDVTCSVAAIWLGLEGLGV